MEVMRLREMHLSKPFDTLVPSLTKIYSYKLWLYDDMVQTAKILIEGPKVGIDYGKLVAHMPEITALLEHYDKSVFNATPLVFATLISQIPDSPNHLSRLIISHGQAQKILSELHIGFGDSLDAEVEDWTVSSASVLRTYLMDKGYKFSDDRPD
jgi:hypothetical protein